MQEGLLTLPWRRGKKKSEMGGGEAEMTGTIKTWATEEDGR